MSVLVTGGAGFLGANFARHAEGRGVVVVDALTYAGDRRRLEGVECRFVEGDCGDTALMRRLVEETRPDVVVHMAAHSHVDRSIAAGSETMRANLDATLGLLDALVGTGVHLVHVSTDEVYGPRETGRSSEGDTLLPSSPYSASKAACEAAVRAWCRTYGLSATVLRPCNCYGEWQHPEKFLPTAIYSALDGEPIPLYGDGTSRREWLSAENLCAALDAAIDRKPSGETFNVGSGDERGTLEIARAVNALVGRDEGEVVFVEDRPGHDKRYALDLARAERTLGFKAKGDLMSALERLVAWYRKHAEWTQALRRKTQKP